MLLRLDYSAIYLFIAGTYTPIALGVVRGSWGLGPVCRDLDDGPWLVIFKLIVATVPSPVHASVRGDGWTGLLANRSRCGGTCRPAVCCGCWGRTGVLPSAWSLPAAGTIRYQPISFGAVRVDYSSPRHAAANRRRPSRDRDRCRAQEVAADRQIRVVAESFLQQEEDQADAVRQSAPSSHSRPWPTCAATAARLPEDRSSHRHVQKRGQAREAVADDQLEDHTQARAISRSRPNRPQPQLPADHAQAIGCIGSCYETGRWRCSPVAGAWP